MFRVYQRTVSSLIETYPSIFGKQFCDWLKILTHWLLILKLCFFHAQTGSSEDMWSLQRGTLWWSTLPCFERRHNCDGGRGFSGNAGVPRSCQDWWGYILLQSQLHFGPSFWEFSFTKLINNSNSHNNGSTNSNNSNNNSVILWTISWS